MTLKNYNFFVCCQLMRHPLIELFHLSNLLQMLKGHRMVDVEFFGNFSCSCKRIGFGDLLNWSLSTSYGRPLCSSSRLLSPLQNFLNHHCTVCSLAVPEPNVLLVMEVVFIVLPPIFNSNKKISWISFLSDITSLVQNKHKINSK